MPVYEYACHKCRKVYQFFSKTLSIPHEPVCPQCGGDGLERVLSSFAMFRGDRHKKDINMEGLGGPNKTPQEDPFDRLSPSQRAAAEREMTQLLGQAESVSEENPRELGHLIERLTQITGFSDPELETAIRRLKDGDPLEKVDEDMAEYGDGGGSGGTSGYSQDPGLYDF